jgi:Spy/CpxP family protein refolding chaperone
MSVNSVKRTSIFVGVIILTTLASGISLAGAQSTGRTPTSTSTAAVQTPGASIIEQLQLTSDQKTKIRGIRVSRTRKINQTLSSTQQTQLRQDLKSGKKLGLALKDLNLNADQKKKILAIVQQSNKDIMATLRPDQQAKLNAYLKQQRQNRAQNPIE